MLIIFLGIIKTIWWHLPTVYHISPDEVKSRRRKGSCLSKGRIVGPWMHFSLLLPGLPCSYLCDPPRGPQETHVQKRQREAAGFFVFRLFVVFVVAYWRCDSTLHPQTGWSQRPLWFIFRNGNLVQIVESSSLHTRLIKSGVFTPMTKKDVEKKDWVGENSRRVSSSVYVVECRSERAAELQAAIELVL